MVLPISKRPLAAVMAPQRVAASALHKHMTLYLLTVKGSSTACVLCLQWHEYCTM